MWTVKQQLKTHLYVQDFDYTASTRWEQSILGMLQENKDKAAKLRDLQLDAM